jgi:hypothetical protein
MLLLAVAASLLAGSTPSGPTPTPRPGLSWSDADSFNRKLIELQARLRRPREAGRSPATTMVVTQVEINSYLNLMLQPTLPAGLMDLDFAIEKDRLAARGLIDLDRVKSSMPKQSLLNPLYYLTGRLPVELKGRLQTDGGFGTFSFDDIRVGPVMIPPAVLGEIVASLTKTPQNPAGFDILAPFRLPYALKKLRLQSGRIVLDL